MTLTQAPALIVCFGVSGCGKSTVAHHLAKECQLTFIEADDFHPPENKAHMAAGKPLTDAMREPWIQALTAHISDLLAQGKNCVMANSALRRAHRQRYRELGYPILWLHLQGSRDLIFDRMRQRNNHFMPATLLDSQFAALESTDGEPHVIDLDIAQPLPDLLKEALRATQTFLTSTTAPETPTEVRT